MTYYDWKLNISIQKCPVKSQCFRQIEWGVQSIQNIIKKGVLLLLYFFWKFHLSITSCNNLIWCTNYPKGSFILYVRKIFRKTNIFYPWYAHVRCFSETFAYVLNEGSQISILILLVSAWVSFEGVFSLWVLALYFPFYRKKWSPKRLVH